MKRSIHKLLTQHGAAAWVLAGILLTAAGCSLWSKPSAGYSAAAQSQAAEEPVPREVYPAGQIPPYVGQIKAIRVHANREKIDTGVDLAAGGLYSLMARGRFFLDSSDPGRGPADRSFVKSIGSGVGTPVFQSETGDTFVSIASGRLFLGIQDKNTKDNLGAIDVIIVTWNTDDYAHIAEFLQKLSERHPGHRGITEAYLKADKVRNLSAARSSTASEIELTKKKIAALQLATKQKGGPSPEVLREQQRELERKLAELTAAMAQLDQLDQQLSQEKARISQLSQELDQERRERERMSKMVAEGKTAPVLLITAPEDGLQVETGSVRLAGAVEDERGLQSLEVFVNGRPLEAAEARGIRQAGESAPRRVNFDRRVPLDEGVNALRVLATDTDGLTAEKTLTLRSNPKRRNVWAVVIGINDYPRLPKLKYAVNDAQAFYRLLVEDNRIPVENVALLLNDQASLVALRSTLGTRLKNAARESDMVIIYFAGHGATERDAASPDGDGLEKYMLAYDSDPSDLYSTALPMVEIGRILNRVRSEQLVFIVDSCYSGGSGGRTVSVGGMRANIADGFLARIAGGRGKVIITASAANEVSVEKDELAHGVFTYYLLEGLRGMADTDHDGMVTVDEAYRYVYDQVPQATGQEQHPVKKGEVEGSLVLSIIH